LYNVFGESFGNGSKPDNGLVDESKLESFLSQKHLYHEKVSFDFKIKDFKTCLIYHQQSFNVVNKSSEPLFEILHSIHTNVEKNFHEIDVKSYDEQNNALKITSINVDTAFEKEFTIQMNCPVFDGDLDKWYKINYVSEESKRKISHLFLLNAKSLDVSLSFPSYSELINPQLSLMTKNKPSIKIEPESISRKGIATTVSWKHDLEICSGDYVLLEW
jgi:hypothetical protein